MPIRSLGRSILAALATSVLCASAVAEHIIDVSILPTCAIGPEDRVTLEAFVGTNYTTGFLDQVSEVAVNQDQVLVDVYVDSCCSPATDVMLATVDLGTFEPGTYEYTLTLHHGTDVDTAVGSFSVGMEPCLPAVRPLARVYWTDSASRVIKRVDLHGFKVENLAVPGLCDIPAGINDFTIDGESEKMYWANSMSQNVDRANLDGSDVEHLVSGVLQGPRGLALDPEADWMYWREQSDTGIAKVRRARLDGTDIEDVVTQGLYRSKGIALDPVEGKVYIGDWTNSVHRFRILRVNVDGSSLETLITSEPDGVSDITVDVEDGKIYWVEDESLRAEHYGTMWRMNVDGTDLRSHVPAADCCPNEIVVDHETGWMYWGGWHVIQRAMLDGSGLEDLFDTGWSQIALDVVGGKMYFTTPGWSELGLSGQVRRANLDGSAPETLATGLGDPDNIAIVWDATASQSIPTVSLWGVATLALLISTASTVVIRNQRRVVS